VSLDDDNIKQILKSRVKAFSNSGAYIPLSQEYEGHEVVVIVMNKK
jgi:putative transposon-encoded protein